ncbi:MAG: stage 0 sporulation family protein [Chloroflexi bacterium]|nr:stage 0 sporulation family protein [Chloroflexota bacterium]
MERTIVGIRFQKIGKLYHFDATREPDLVPGDFAVVETSRGIQLGQVMGIIADPPRPPKGTWKHIKRKATAQDLIIRQSLEQREVELMVAARAAASDKGYQGLKIVKAEFSFDGGTVALLYNTEDEGEPNLGKLRAALKQEYPDLNVEFRRVGPRDVAKILGGMGACGLASRCCSTFLTEFSPISIKMAKAQGISLDPAEITGMCGRLRCCLIYEYEQYVEARKILPKRGKKVVTPMGEGVVLDSIPLKDSVIVRLNDEQGTRAEFLKHELEPWDELEALRRKSEGACDRHEGGGCTCGKADAEAKTQGGEPPETDD